VQSRGDMEGLPLRHELPEHTPSLKTASAL